MSKWIVAWWSTIDWHDHVEDFMDEQSAIAFANGVIRDDPETTVRVAETKLFVSGEPVVVAA